jgi:hypothetical protein
MATSPGAACFQLALTPTPAVFERIARRAFRRREARLARVAGSGARTHNRSLLDQEELRGGLAVQHRPLFFAELRVLARERRTCEVIAAALRADSAENRLIERGATFRQGVLGVYGRRVRRGEGNPLPSLSRGVYASTELAAMWHLPAADFAAVPLARSGLPVAPAPPAILRVSGGRGALRDALGPVSIHPELRRQNTAVPGAVDQGKSSYLVATLIEDLRRERCAVIVLDPKGDAAEAALSAVDPARTCTLLDFAHPTCGFNPLAVDAPADVIADYVVGALKNLFTDADIRASSDRYLRNAIIAVLAFDRGASLWDAARLLSVGEEGYAYRRAVAARVRALPEFKEIAAFFTAELSAQLADSRSMTTAKLDAPVNKFARLLNSASIKRVLLNDSLRIDFDSVIARAEVLIVRGALGRMGAGNTAVLMQLLVGMLDAALSRQQDLLPESERVAVALKVDEAPLVLNRGFAETMALKRSAGLETVACWQSDAQWTDREVRDQLDALFAHRVYFATSSARDARHAAGLMMPEFSDTVRPGIACMPALARPDARLHLPKHWAIASWTTPGGRQPPFLARTIPMALDPARVALHARSQFERGARHQADLRQPHWLADRGGGRDQARGPGPAGALEAPATASSELPARAAESYRELVDLDRAHSVRWATPPPLTSKIDPDEIDRQMLGLLAGMRHVLSSQLHRRFNAARAPSTTQRRLKRLADAGLVERFQFHRRDGGGVPMCYALTPAGASALSTDPSAGPHTSAHARSGGARRERDLRQARHDVHVTGWALAVAGVLGARCHALRGGEDAVLSPPRRAEGRAAIGPGELRLPGGRVPHDFLSSRANGERVEVEHFDSLRPDALLELGAARGEGTRSPASPIDLIVELDDRFDVPAATAKLERYEHFLAGWAAHTARYGRMGVSPLVVFVCRSRARARGCARAADPLLVACQAYAGEYPFDWRYPAREQIVFVSERDAHEGLLEAYGVPRLPPSVRVTAARGDPRAGEAAAPRSNSLLALVS